MGAVAASAVTFNDVWYTADTGPNMKCTDVTVVLSSQGGLTNNIPAALFGMRKIRECSSAVDSAGSLLLVAAPSYDRNYVCIYQLTNATDATRTTPADISLTIRLIVKGVE